MKVLITDNVHQLLIDDLSNEGYDVTYLPDIHLNEVKNIIKDYHIIVINTKTKMDKEMLDYASKLKLIIRLGSGLDIIDLDYANLAATLGIGQMSQPLLARYREMTQESAVEEADVI